ncbi:hypothetical protein [Cohnella rhizosphaerae]|uniref:Uncharacterized protein n=1 Tax=Cohnella rhizosphaerae TaxID=1457232 RepID=A0A9X4QU34_9BACL|nr:hypothetical protein [Cohnella rhizosphaerae]MDG0811841.1 hypothetical protein [Cohnella rhizosphaerae]
MAKYRVLLEADQKTYVLAFANTLSIVCNTAIVVLMARSGLNIVLLKYIAILAVLSRSVVLYLYVKIKYKYINYSATPIYAALSKRWDALYMQIMNSAYLGAPIIIATLFFKFNFGQYLCGI